MLDDRLEAIERQEHPTFDTVVAAVDTADGDDQAVVARIDRRYDPTLTAVADTIADADPVTFLRWQNLHRSALVQCAGIATAMDDGRKLLGFVAVGSWLACCQAMAMPRGTLSYGRWREAGVIDRAPALGVAAGVRAAGPESSALKSRRNVASD